MTKPTKWISEKAKFGHGTAEVVPPSSSSSSDVEKGSEGAMEDAVFGNLESGPNFRGVSAPGAFVLMTKANLGLGVLAIPTVFNLLGIVPGILVIVGCEMLLFWCARFVGPFKIRHADVYGVADAAFVFAGPWGRWTMYVIFTVFMIFCTASAIVGVSTALNAMSSHGACTAVFTAVAAIAGFLLSSIRTLSKVSWIGWAGITSIIASVIILTIGVGVQDRPSEAPQAPLPWDKGFQVIGHPTFVEAMSAINIILFSSSATPMYFGVVSEMRDPRKYTRSMGASLTFLTAVYLIIGSVVYHYCGQYVASPALGSAGIVLKKVCYGIAFPGLLASLTIFNHISAKNIFVRVLHGSKHLSSNSVTHWAVWLGCTAGSVLLAYIIASAIPIFGSLIGFIGALMCPAVAIIPECLMWFYDNWWFTTKGLTTGKIVTGVINIVVILIGCFFTVGGTYAAVLDLIATSVDSGPWTCVNNSGRLH